jgi:hypothetical protein
MQVKHSGATKVIIKFEIESDSVIQMHYSGKEEDLIIHQ